MKKVFMLILMGMLIGPVMSQVVEDGSSIESEAIQKEIMDSMRKAKLEQMKSEKEFEIQKMKMQKNNTNDL